MTSYEELDRASTRGSYMMVTGERLTAQHVLDERRRAALAEIDEAPFSWTHTKVCVVAGVGFFTDAYAIFAINIAATMLGYVYGDQCQYRSSDGKQCLTSGDPNARVNPNYLKLRSREDLGLKIAAPIGIFLGQLFFGFLADMVGRKKMYGLELSIIIVATFAQAISANGNAINIVGVLIIWRFVMGIGIGGDYPLSAIITSEFSATKFRGRMMSAVVSAQGFGNFCAALVALIFVSAYKQKFPSVSLDSSNQCPGLNPPADFTGTDFIWRIVIGLGCVPGVMGLFFRLTIPETPRFTMDIERNIDRATHDIHNVFGGQNEPVDEEVFIQRIDTPRASLADFCAHFSQKRNFRILFGAAWSWFALDIAFYGLGLNTSTVFSAISAAIDRPILTQLTACVAYNNLHNLCASNLIVSVAGLIPGYWVAFLFIDKVGRKPIQLLGFSVLTVLLIILGVLYQKLPSGDHLGTTSLQKAYFFLYCLANFFQNCGPNVSTFVIPGEVFPTRYRSTAYGISAASGKLGAIIAQIVFWRFSQGRSGIQSIMIILAVFMSTGILSTLLLPETKGLTLEELSNEKQEGFVRGAKNSNFFSDSAAAPVQMARF